MNIETLNKMPVDSAGEWFKQACTSERWCQRMTASRPYTGIEHLNTIASQHWDEMNTADFIQAFAGHPMIGDIDSLRAKYANTKAIAADEQRGMQQADDATFEQLSRLNHEYLDKHGFIFIICATGLTATQMLHALQGRINNTTEQERATAAQEQLKITLLRFKKALRELG